MTKYSLVDILNDFHALTCLSLAEMLPDVHPVSQQDVPKIDLPFFHYPGPTLDDYVCPQHGTQKIYNPCDCMRQLGIDEAIQLMEAIEVASEPLFELLEKRWQVPNDLDQFAHTFVERLVDLANWLDLGR